MTAPLSTPQNRHDARAEGIGLWILRHRWMILLISLAAAGAAGAGVARVRISHDTRIFFGAGNLEYREFTAFEETFGRSDTVVFLLAPAEGTVFSRRPLEALTALTDAAWKIPHARRVLSLANFPVTTIEDDTLVARNLFEIPSDSADSDMTEIRRLAMEEGALAHRLVSPSGHVAGVYVSLEMPTGGIGREPVVAEAAHRTADEIRERYPDMDVRLTGSVMLAEAFGEASRQNLRTLVPLMLFIMVVILGFSLRSLPGLCASIAVILLAVLTGLGMAGWLQIPLTAVSVSGPGLIVTLAVADCVHVLRAMLRRLQAGQSKTEAILGSMQTNVRAVFLTSATTAVGFFSLNFSESPPFRDLGNIVGMGVSAAFIYAILFLPALMAILPSPAIRPSAETDVHRRMARLAEWIIRRPRRILAGLALCVGATALGLPRIELNDTFVEYFNDSFAVRRDTDFLIQTLGGVDSIEYAFDSGKPGGIADPGYLVILDRFADEQRTQPRVVSVYTLADTLKQVNRTLLGLEEDRLPETRDEAAQLLFLHELALPPGLDLGAWVDLDRSTSRVQVVYESLSAREVREAARNAQAWIDAHVPSPLRAHGTGLSLLWANITHRNIRSMLGGSLLALALVSLLLGVPLRDLRLGAFSLLPNLLPPIMALGIWGLLRGQVGLALSVVVAMTIGIVVDDTIHFLIQYQRARRVLNLDAAGAIVHVFRTVGAALCTTTVALVGGFLVLCLSPYRISSDVGFLCALILALALILDLLLLPALLLLTDQTTPATRLKGKSNSLSLLP